MDVLGNLWSEKFWLPGNITWSDIEPGTRDGVTYRNYYDLWWSIPLAILITAVKSIVIRFCFAPFGRFLHIKSTKPHPPSENVVLEKFYQKHQTLPSGLQIDRLTKQADLTEREIERWWRKRRAQDKATTLNKFCDNCWRCTFYFFNFSFGLNVLWDRPWLWTLRVVDGYPFHSIDNGIWWYYNNTMAFYLSLSLTHFYETRRKDFWQMLIHHVITLALLSVSWTCNGIRGGTLIVFVHDVADILLEGVKAIKYTKAQTLCSAVFLLFLVVWIFTRLFVYGRIVYLGIFGFFKLGYPLYPLFFVIAGLTISLLVLHILWTYMIFQVASRLIATNAVDDVRSSSEDSDDENDDGSSESESDINGNEVMKNGKGKSNGHVLH